MEFTRAELDVLEAVAKDTTKKETEELFELQLALNGGGIADPVWA